MSKEGAMATMRQIFHDDGNCFHNASILYDLAQEAQSGCIVEVGTAGGMGAVALGLGTRDGARLPVYAIDPLVLTSGWIGEEYGPALREEWYRHILLAGVAQEVILVGVPVQIFIRWPEHAALTFWDTGLWMSTCGLWLDSWLACAVEPGDLVAINETRAGDLGVDEWLAEREYLRVLETRNEIRICERI